MMEQLIKLDIDKVKSSKNSHASWRIVDKLPCVFMQYDGEARVLFHPLAQKWELKVQQVMQVPVVVNLEDEGPPASSPSSSVTLRYTGSDEEVAWFKSRLFMLAHGQLVSQLNACEEEVEELASRVHTSLHPKFVCENESCLFRVGWREHKDHYTDQDEKTCEKPPEAWTKVIDSDTDREGWKYGCNCYTIGIWRPARRSYKHPTDTFRQRRWTPP